MFQYDQSERGQEVAENSAMIQGLYSFVAVKCQDRNRGDTRVERAGRKGIRAICKGREAKTFQGSVRDIL